MSTPFPTDRPTLLLVHGGHHGSWVWEKLQAELGAEGWRTETVDLPSAVRDESRPEPLPGMFDDARVVRAAIDAIDGPVVVVAHSYAGMPVTQATAGAPNVVHLVYVAAYMPDLGEAMFPIHGVPTPDSLAGLRSPVNPENNQPATFFDGNPDNPDTALASARLVPQTIRADFEAVTQVGWKTISSSYVIPDDELSVVALVEERMAARAGAVYHAEGNHAPFYSHPKEFAALLGTIVDKAGAGS
ncbi:alpha/beta fold hydrolase [Micromonospora sp. NBC_01796]|uniref:alpha/beta fold hydrolase n=1 Tax=Micromonospora sp. NBC_01796 TaxID=2975987 RepID=UPI002DD808F9|nr:alpha/beta fold hydrolase [Micromonospora sp. NBC_01796]WSA85695.1 alpha/beta fold hydrolase [Micromonospora sp. NBC_01796]